MKITAKRLVAAVAASVCAWVANAAIDGTFWGKNDNGTFYWSSTQYWLNRTYATDGGVAWFNDSQLDCLNVDVEGITLGGLQIGGRWMHITGNPLTFTAENSWITRTSYSYGTHKPGFDVTFKGTGSNTISINDNGEFHMRVAAQDFGNFRVLGNHVMAWNTSGDCFTEGNFQLSEGRASIAPQLAAGETAEVTIGANEGTKFAYGPSLGYLRLNKGSGDGVTLKIGTLERFTGGGALAIEATTGLDNLGGTEKVLVTNGAPTVVNGICDASIVGHDYKSSPESFCFLTYDETDGFKKATVETKAFADAGANDIAAIDANTEISGEKAVHALYVNAKGDGPTITFADDSKLTVGDGVHPAGIIINAKDGNRIQPAFSGANGTIAFGGAQGTIYFNNPANQPTLTINQTITGTGGMVFTGSGTGTKSTLTLPRAAGWTGNTVISRICFYVTNANQLPEDGDVYVLGGKNGQKAASLRITDNITFGENQRFHFGGWGASDNLNVIHTGGGDTTVTHNGPVEFIGPTGFIDDGLTYSHIFNGTVSGYGWCQLHQGTYVFNGPITYSGDLRLVAANSRLVFSGNATPSAIRQISYSTTAATMTFKDFANEVDFTTPVTGKGNLVVQNAAVKLNGKQAYGTITVGAGARIGLGKDVTYDGLVMNGGEIYMLEGATDARLRFAPTEDTRLTEANAIPAEHGLVKAGEKTLTIARDAGIDTSITIENGTVKLAGSLMDTDDCVYWMDAANASTVTTDDNGYVTKWVSANGNGATFNRYASAGGEGPFYDTTQNGKKVMRFVNASSAKDARFASTAEFTHRSVYLVLATEYPDWAETPEQKKVTLTPWGWQGAGGTSTRSEHGIRYQWYSSGYGLLGFASKYAMNGKSSLAFTPKGEYQIVRLINDVAEHTVNYYTTFPVGIGGYATWQSNNNFHGKIAEVIAFNRVNTDAEINEIENYLAEKWGLTDKLWHEGVAEAQVLDTDIAIALAPRGVFDLNGVNQTVASLSGEGTITNSSSKAAVLTVTGSCAFSGRIVGNVTVKTCDGAILNVDMPDAALSVTDGTATLNAYAEMPPTNGIVYWLDAARPDLITWVDEEEQKNVASVKSRAGIEKFYLTGYYKGAPYPTYETNVIGGNKPAFSFRGATGKAPQLRTGSTMTTKTIVMVLQLPPDAATGNYFWGIYNADRGFRTNGGTSFDWGYSFCDVGWGFVGGAGGYRWVDGTKARMDSNGGGNVSIPSDKPLRLIVERPDWSPDTTYVNKQQAIGSYENRACDMYFAEVIAYDRLLTDDEIATLDSYLAKKWSGESLPTARTAVFGATSTLAVNGGTVAIETEGETVGTLAAGSAGGTVNGKVTTGAFVYDAESAESPKALVVDDFTASEGATFAVTGLDAVNREAWTLLEAATATGSFNGGFTSTRKGWSLRASENAWAVCPIGVLLFLK